MRRCTTVPAGLVTRSTTSATAGASGVPTHHDGSRGDDRGVACFVEERPDVAGVVLVVEISGDVDRGHQGRE